MALSVTAIAQAPPIEPGVSQDLAKWRAVRYSNVRYKLNLTLEKMSPVLKGTMEIRLQYAAEACAECPPRFIVLDWRRIRGHEEKSTITNVSINGKTAVRSSSLSWLPIGAETSMGSGGPPKGGTPSFGEHNEHLIFSDGVVMGENVIKLDFTSPILTSGSAITRYVDKEDGSEYLYSLFVPSDASTAFPVFDQPDIKARFTLNLKVPAGWQPVSNEDYFEIRSSRKSQLPTQLEYQFAETRPVSTYVFAFAAGEFQIFGYLRHSNLWSRRGNDETRRTIFHRRNQELEGSSVYVRKSQAAKFKQHADEVFRLNREAVGYFEEYFNYKFPFPKYDLVLIPEFPFGGMEHAGATFLRESSIIFPQEPTRNDHISRATLIFHEAAHQWFGDTVTMRWFDDLWLKEGFATFTAYKALEKIMPEMNSWKVFYERVKQGAYATDSTKGTTPIYQEIKNLSAAKSAYGSIVYNKAPAFLRQAEFYLGEDKFQAAVRSFLKKHEFGNAGWEDLISELETASKRGLKTWANGWVRTRGGPVIRSRIEYFTNAAERLRLEQYSSPSTGWQFKSQILWRDATGSSQISTIESKEAGTIFLRDRSASQFSFVFPNYQDYGYGIFLLDDKSREYILKNIQNEKDPFLRSMTWGALWDSVREGELDPREYVELVVRVQSASSSSSPGGNETSLGNGERDKSRTLNEDESTTALLLNRVGTAMNYYIEAPGGTASVNERGVARGNSARSQRSLTVASLPDRVEDMLIAGMRNSETLGQRITYYRAFLNIASSEKARGVLKGMLRNAGTPAGDTKTDAAKGGGVPLKAKDRFDIVTKLLILNDPEAPKLLADLEKTETSDDAKRYAYAARAGIGTAANKAKYWNDFVNNKEINESWIEAAFGPWNSIRHSDLTLPYLRRALQELPNHKRNRKIFFVNGWLGAFIGGQRSEEALSVVNKFLTDNPGLDNDLRLKILENVDVIERAVRIRGRYK